MVTPKEQGDQYVVTVQETTSFLQKQLGDFHPRVAITLGSGLGKGGV